jgi:hypothetical protein
MYRCSLIDLQAFNALNLYANATYFYKQAAQCARTFHNMQMDAAQCRNMHMRLIKFNLCIYVIARDELTVHAYSAYYKFRHGFWFVHY